MGNVVKKILQNTPEKQVLKLQSFSDGKLEELRKLHSKNLGRVYHTKQI